MGLSRDLSRIILSAGTNPGIAMVLSQVFDRGWRRD
jgi:hypothetical protein